MRIHSLRNELKPFSKRDCRLFLIRSMILPARKSLYIGALKPCSPTIPVGLSRRYERRWNAQRLGPILFHWFQEEKDVKALNSLVISGREVLPLIEGGKGISVSNGESSGAWAASGGVGTFSGVNADSYDANGNFIPQVYRGKTRRDRHEELIAYAIKGGIMQAQKAHDLANG